MKKKLTLSRIYSDMMNRCYNPKDSLYPTYGAKKITVCDEWHDKNNFISWAKNNGYEKGLYLKRLDCSIGYCPTNCVFYHKSLPWHMKPKYQGVMPEYIKKKEEQKRKNEIRESYGVPKPYSQLKIYQRYNGMISRCRHQTSNSDTAKKIKKYYTDRGITVCEEWEGEIGFYRFYQWAMNNGYQDGLSLDRINNDKGYSPDNCRWIPLGEQTRNRRNNVRYDYHGEQLLLIEICEKENISYDALKYRVVKMGQEMEQAISEIRKHKDRADYLNSPETNPLGCALRDIRIATGLTQEEFAKKHHISDNIIQDWEEGKKTPIEVAKYLLRKLIKECNKTA